MEKGPLPKTPIGGLAFRWLMSGPWDKQRGRQLRRLSRAVLSLAQAVHKKVFDEGRALTAGKWPTAAKACHFPSRHIWFRLDPNGAVLRVAVWAME